jgi:hypothetical protein
VSLEGRPRFQEALVGFSVWWGKGGDWKGVGGRSSETCEGSAIDGDEQSD